MKKWGVTAKINVVVEAENEPDAADIVMMCDMTEHRFHQGTGSDMAWCQIDEVVVEDVAEHLDPKVLQECLEHLEKEMEHCTVCQDRGWLIMHNDEYGLRVERCSACDQLECDEEAYIAAWPHLQQFGPSWMSVEQSKDILVRLEEDVAEMESDKPTVKLVGEDGNVFEIISRVSQALKNARQEVQADEFYHRAFSASSYDEVLRLAMEYCEVE